MATLKKVPDKKMQAGAWIGLIMGFICIGILIIFAIFMIISAIVIAKNLVEAEKIFGNWLAIFKIMAPLIIIGGVGIATIIIWLCWKVLNGKATNGVAAGITLLIASLTIMPLGIAGIIGCILLIIGNYETKNEATSSKVA